MVLFTFVEFAVETGIWTIKTTYKVGYWLLYGKPKTSTEILLESQNKALLAELNEIKHLHDDLVIITRRLEHLEGASAHEQLRILEDQKETVKQ